MDKSDIADALYNAAGANEDKEINDWAGKARIVGPKAVSKLRSRILAFLGEMPEEWTISELIDAMNGDREDELDPDEDMQFPIHRHEG